MVSIGNKAKLVNSETCQKCGKCCKVFTSTEYIDYALRFRWMNHKRIKTEDTPFQFEKGDNQKLVTFKFPCSQLEQRKDGKYYCKVWDGERPDFCNTYPDHLFYCCELWNREKIQALLNHESKVCPGLKRVTIGEVIKMLEEMRG